jgi:hypothetical protein
MAITTYATLRTELNNFTERSYTTDQVDTFCGLAEAKFNRILGPQHRRETTGTLNTDTSGEVALPADFLAMRSIVRDLAGSVPLIAVGWETLLTLNPDEVSGTPVNYAINGTTLKVAPICDDNFNIVYWAKLSGLSSAGNSTNWLIALAPDAYLFMVMGVAAAMREEWATAQGMEDKATDIVRELIGQSTVAQYANAEMILPGYTP